jgi:hypothetical protein
LGAAVVESASSKVESCMRPSRMMVSRFSFMAISSALGAEECSTPAPLARSGSGKVKAFKGRVGAGVGACWGVCRAIAG